MRTPESFFLLRLRGAGLSLRMVVVIRVLVAMCHSLPSQFADKGRRAGMVLRQECTWVATYSLELKQTVTKQVIDISGL